MDTELMLFHHSVGTCPHSGLNECRMAGPQAGLVFTQIIQSLKIVSVLLVVVVL